MSTKEVLSLIFSFLISSTDKKQLDEFVRFKSRYIARDRNDKLVFMAESRSWLQMVQDNYPSSTLLRSTNMTTLQGFKTL